MGASNYYEILGVPKNATQDEIKAAYRACAKKYHPDANEVGNANVIFVMIKEAYDVLGDSVKRAAYDEKLDKPQSDFKNHEPTAYEHNYTAEKRYSAAKPHERKRKKLSFSPLGIITFILLLLFKIILLPIAAVIFVLGNFLEWMSIFASIIVGLFMFITFVMLVAGCWEFFWGDHNPAVLIASVVIGVAASGISLLINAAPEFVLGLSEKLFGFIFNR